MKHLTYSTVAFLTLLVVIITSASFVDAQESEVNTLTGEATTTAEVSVFDAEPVRTQLNLEAEGDFVVGPGKTEVTLAPGESVVKYVSVTSRIATSTTFDVSVEDLVGTDSSDQTVRLLGEQRGPYSLQDYLTPALDEFTLGLGEKIQVPVRVSVPADAEPGGYYGAVIISNAPSKEDGAAQTTVISRAGAIFLVRVEGLVDESGQVTDFRMSGPNKLIHQGGSFSFEVLFENTGSVHLVPYGQIIISNLFGKSVGVVPVDAYFALPDATRYRQVEWSPDRFLLGRYTAKLTLNRGYGGKTDVRTLHFWVIPWKVMAGIFVVALLLGMILRWFTSRFELRRK